MIDVNADRCPKEVHTYLLSESATVHEQLVLKWQFGLYGSFYTALWQAMTLADPENLLRLEKGFPEQVAALKEWRYGTMAARLQLAGLPV